MTRNVTNPTHPDLPKVSQLDINYSSTITDIKQEILSNLRYLNDYEQNMENDPDYDHMLGEYIDAKSRIKDYFAMLKVCLSQHAIKKFCKDNGITYKEISTKSIEIEIDLS